MKSVQAIIGARDVITVERLTTIADTARLMASRHIGAVPVLDNGRLVGIFSERDVLTRIVADGRNPATTRVGDVMSTDLLAANVADSCEDCRARMQQAHVRHLVVLDGGRLVGVVSLRDVLAAYLDEKEDELTMLSAYVHDIPPHLQATIPRRP
jgi:CBS domain-containing protein